MDADLLGHSNPQHEGNDCALQYVDHVRDLLGVDLTNDSFNVSGTSAVVHKSLGPYGYSVLALMSECRVRLIKTFCAYVTWIGPCLSILRCLVSSAQLSEQNI